MCELWIRNHHVEIQCSVQRGVNNYNMLLSTVHKQNHHFVALCWYHFSQEALKRGPFPYLEVLFMRSCAIVRWKLISHLFSMLLFPGLEKKTQKACIWEQKIQHHPTVIQRVLKKGGGWFEPRPAALYMTRCWRFELHWSRHRCGFTCLGIDNSISKKVKNLQKILQGK